MRYINDTQMKKWLPYSLLIVMLSALSPVLLSSCSRKTGCPSYETVHTKTNRKGELSTKRGKSSLFPKNMRGKR